MNRGRVSVLWKGRCDMLTEQEKIELDEVVENMAEDFEDIKAQNDGEPLDKIMGGIEKAVERDRYIMKKLYERYPDCGNRIPLYLATHTGRVTGLNLLGTMTKDRPAELVKIVRFSLLAPRYSAIWDEVQKEAIEEELGNL